MDDLTPIEAALGAIRPTTVVWVPHVADLTAPRVQEIEAGVELNITKDETVSGDPASVLPPHTLRYRVDRWPLDETHEIVAVAGPLEKNDSAPELT